MQDLFNQLSGWALLEIAIIAFVIYQLLLILRGTRAMQMVAGLFLAFGALFVLSQMYPLNTLKWMLEKLYPSIMIVLVILFQEDIRKVLSGIGRRSFVKQKEKLVSQSMIDEVVRACMLLAQRRIGALVTFERDILLNRYIELGVSIHGKVVHQLIVSIFHPSSPLHDGSIIIQHGEIAAAGCFLPLTKDPVDFQMGSRHRAAIGMTQETDAVVVLVSEEHGTVSLVHDGRVTKNLTAKECRKALRNVLADEAKHPYKELRDVIKETWIDRMVKKVVKRS